MDANKITSKVRKIIIGYANKKSDLNCWGYLYEPQKPKCLTKKAKERR